MAQIIARDTKHQLFGELPPVGSKAPDFSLVTVDFKDVTGANWLGKRKILNIMVSTDASTCANSVIAFDRYAEKLDDVAMLMISADLPFAHERFRKEHGLKHVTCLSSLRNAGFGKHFGVLITDGPLEGLFAQAVLVLDENNSVVYAELAEDVAQEPDYAAIFRSLGIELED